MLFLRFLIDDTNFIFALRLMKTVSIKLLNKSNKMLSESNVVLITKLGMKPFIKTLKVKAGLMTLASIMMFIWFVPSLAYYAYSNYNIYIMMNIMGIGAGILTYLVYFSLEKLKAAYIEFNSMMFSMTALVFFYISIIGLTDMFPFFGIKQQLYFSAILWAVSLPFMWLSTIDTMYRYSIPETPILIKNHDSKIARPVEK